MLGVAFRKKRDDASVTQALPDCLRVVSAVSYHAIRTMAWMPKCSLQRWDIINQRKRLLAVVAIGPSELNCQWNALPITNQMTLAAEFSPIGRIGTGLLPPKTARIELPSTIARDQSIFWERASQSRSTKWSNCQIPASCQLRKRRQQVMPDPYPSSWGSISQGTPLRNTNMMPARHARSAKRGLPPLGLALGVGMKGSMSCHNLSGRSASGIGESSWIEGYTWCRSRRSR